MKKRDPAEDEIYYHWISQLTSEQYERIADVQIRMSEERREKQYCRTCIAVVTIVCVALVTAILGGLLICRT